MRDLKTLKELVASITDWKSLEKMSCKPFKPSILHLAISKDAPQLYREEELIQLQNFNKLLSSVESKPETNNTGQRMTRKRKIEKMPKEETVKPAVIKIPRKIVFVPNGPSPDLPAEFKNRVSELSGHDLKFLMHKILYCSDVKPNSNRLSMPINEIKCEFLTEAEITKLDVRDGPDGKGRLVGVEVTVLDPCLREFTLSLKKWSMQRTDTYNLVTNWNKIVSANKFEEDQELQIWSFRVENKLYLLLNKL